MSFPSSGGGFDSRSPLQFKLIIFKMPLKSNYRNIFKNISEKKSNYFFTGSPGTGKSYSLINLAAYLIEQKNISPEKIIVFTFNRKTSKYYREEIAGLINKSIG